MKAFREGEGPPVVGDGSIQNLLFRIRTPQDEIVSCQLCVKIERYQGPVGRACLLPKVGGSHRIADAAPHIGFIRQICVKQRVVCHGRRRRTVCWRVQRVAVMLD